MKNFNNILVSLLAIVIASCTNGKPQLENLKAPVALSKSIRVAEDSFIEDVLKADDEVGNELSFEIVTPPEHGEISGDHLVFRYTPDQDYSGGDSFTFIVLDGTFESEEATVEIEVIPVNDAPKADQQSIATKEDAPVAIDLTATDAEGNAVSYSIVTAPSHGVLSGSGASRTYQPDANYFGSDGFTYRASDGIDKSKDIMVSISISPVNDAPQAMNLGGVMVSEDSLVIFNLAAGYDVDGDALSYVIASQPAHGTLNGTGATQGYTPAANYFGDDSFTYQIGDGTALSNIATVSIRVSPVEDKPIANAQLVAVNEDTPKSIVLTGFDADSDPLTFSVMSYPSKGSLAGTGANRTYTPTANYSGTDSFTFKVNDGKADSAIVTVGIVVSPVNDAPIANAQSVSVTSAAPLAITLTGNDVEASPLTFSIVSAPTKGTLSGTAPNVIYTPSGSSPQADSFTFKVNDGAADSNIAAVSLSTGVSDDAESGSVNWVASNSSYATYAVGWHISTRKSSSPTHSFYYGSESSGSYSTGSSRNYGTLTMISEVDLTASVSPTLTFKEFSQVEGSTSYDRTRVNVCIGASCSTVFESHGTGGVWAARNVNLSAFIGQKIKLQFSFDTVDGIGNTYEGWYIDDVQLLY